MYHNAEDVHLQDRQKMLSTLTYPESVFTKATYGATQPEMVDQRDATEDC